MRPAALVVGPVAPLSDVNKFLAQFSPGNPGHDFFELVAVTLATLFMQQSTEASGRISCGLLREGVLGS